MRNRPPTRLPSIHDFSRHYQALSYPGTGIDLREQCPVVLHAVLVYLRRESTRILTTELLAMMPAVLRAALEVT